MSRMICSFAIVLSASLLPAVSSAQQSSGEVASSAAKQTYLDFQVEQVVRVKTATPPLYPTHLRAARVEGEVLAQFVVDERGQALMSTFKVLKSDDEAFSESVKRAVTTTTFVPAEVGGQKVRQLVQQPFKFKASR